MIAAGRQALQIVGWTIVVSLLLMPFLERGSAEFIITACSLGAGLIFGSAVLIMMRRSMR